MNEEGRKFYIKVNDLYVFCDSYYTITEITLHSEKLKVFDSRDEAQKCASKCNGVVYEFED